MHVCVDRGRIDEWMCFWMYGCVWVGGCMGGCIVNVWVDGWMYGWTQGGSSELFCDQVVVITHCVRFRVDPDTLQMLIDKTDTYVSIKDCFASTCPSVLNYAHITFHT